MTAYKIAIVGPGGSGKTTLALKLAARLAVPAVHLDDHLFRSRHVLAESEQGLRVADLLAGDAWIVEGAAWRVLDAMFAAATIIVVVDTPFRRSFPRLVRRELQTAWKGWTLRTLRGYVEACSPIMWAFYYPLAERRRALQAAQAPSVTAKVIIARDIADAERRIQIALKP